MKAMYNTLKTPLLRLINGSIGDSYCYDPNLRKMPFKWYQQWIIATWVVVQ